MDSKADNWMNEYRTSALLLLLLVVFSRLISSMGHTLDLKLWPCIPYPECLAFDGRLDSYNTHLVAGDFGNLSRHLPSVVLYPASLTDIAKLVKSVYGLRPYSGLTVAARGHGHSLHGQAQAPNGVVIEMGALRGINVDRSNAYVDVTGGELWIDVLHATLKEGLAPKSWTDYLYLSVGGTLSNAGISGQAFQHGPQISNVQQLEVVTGKGEILNCSRHQNVDLFQAVLGGLGQFGIITKARIELEPAPQRVRWIRVLYSDFAAFTRDQEYLISLPKNSTFDYVEGFVIVNNEGLLNNWRSSYFSPQNPVKVSSLDTKGRVLYCLEMTKNYNEHDAVHVIDEAVESFLKPLDFIPASVFTTDLSYVEFLDRVHTSELKLRSKGLWEVPHPWLNLFIPKSRIADFDAGVFKDILRNTSSGPILIYPMNRSKWDNRTSAVTPDDKIFYLVGLLRSALPSGSSDHSLDLLMDQNKKILRFCREQGLGVKQYLPHYSTEADWKIHFGPKWEKFVQRKAKYDPNAILAPGQGIFHGRRPFNAATLF